MTVAKNVLCTPQKFGTTHKTVRFSWFQYINKTLLNLTNSVNMFICLDERQISTCYHYPK